MMQIVLLVRRSSTRYSPVNGEPLVLMGLTVFNAMLGLRGKSRAAASLAALAGTMKSITRVRIAFLGILMATEFRFLQRILGLTSLSGNQRLICIFAAIALLLVDEVIKIFLRSCRSHDAAIPAVAAPARA